MQAEVGTTRTTLCSDYSDEREIFISKEAHVNANTAQVMLLMLK